MKFIVLFTALWAGAAQAESLCGVTDRQVVLDAIAGDWSARGATSVESETLSVVDQTAGRYVFDAQGRFSSIIVEAVAEPPAVVIDADSPTLGALGVFYDVDQVDDILETVEAAWIADEVSLTPCGPEELPQLQIILRDGEASSGVMVIVPYFSDKMVAISEVEMRGDWGLAFVTSAALLTATE